MKIEWLILSTSNYDKSKNFYSKVMGFKIEREEEDDEFCQFSLENISFAIFGINQLEKLLDKKYLGKPGDAIYSLPESDNVKRQYEDLKRKGVRFIKDLQTQPWGQKTAYFTDPDGHIWEIQQWIK